jgi:predicted nucleic acid-binding protein
MSIFVDTGAFYALADTHDKHHEQAKSCYAASAKSDLLLTSEYIFKDAFTFDHHFSVFRPKTGMAFRNHPA